MTEFEIIILTQEFSRSVAEQFNFWMATTFAVVIASYTAGEKLNGTIRIFVAVLYIGACTVYFFRYLDVVENIVHYMSILKEMESEYSTRNITVVTIARRMVMLGGSVLAILMIFKSNIGTVGQGAVEDE